MENKKDNKDKIEWLGMDGVLVIGFFLLVAVIFCSFKFRIDFLTAWVFPIVLLIIVCSVTLNYAKTLRGFIKMQNEQLKKGKKK
ncbi:MAG: hypothetical protein MR303_00230 [Emergencia sp.]|nr:hypothetical protein [Emergencia sp.]